MNEQYVKKLIRAKKCIAPIIKESAQTKQSGIYLFERTDENGVVFFYCGQAVNIYQRIVGHWLGFQRIDLSIRKRRFQSQENPYGWKFTILEHCNKDLLDDRERFHILQNLKAGKQTYNLTYGSQGEGKQTVGEGKIPKGYYDGKKQGYLDARKYVANLFDKHLIYDKKSQKPNKHQEKAMDKFKDFLNWKEGEKNEN